MEAGDPVDEKDVPLVRPEEEALETTPNFSRKTGQLMERGVKIPNPFMVDIGDEVRADRISTLGVTIYPGCRIRGRDTVISSGVQLGLEGPVTLDDCQVGPDVHLMGGFFRRSVFLRKATAGWGAHVREGCILEEEASCAHCVGLKQTILFPFVTLGSLINFCDCLMAGGTSAKDHSEVGSSYIHFNFSPDGDKATASLFGDVPRGVMLNQSAIFLGGQGGAVGPLRVDYGNVISAGTILRKDVVSGGNLVVGRPPHGGIFHFVRYRYAGLSRLVEHNIRYLANLAALEQWYLHVRKETLAAYELGEHIHAGALQRLALAKTERVLRLKAVAEKMPHSIEVSEDGEKGKEAKLQLHQNIQVVCDVFESDVAAAEGVDERHTFLDGLTGQMKTTGRDHVSLIQSLPAPLSEIGTRWLEAIVHNLCRKAADLLPALQLFWK